ncbi:zinc finger CCCH domain-containing protein 62-like [Chenopodium quinoa]|uniref:C3H1-type domain-containing protein n=1 Tax=Chenopodium quinoa TaxID=63459 RepID=A0A803KQY4_CHEQI|nr:zinc finger CCCH domain-containing protein 62-like [Chenopodium quinoa]
MVLQMAKSLYEAQNAIDFTDLEDSDYNEFGSDDSEEDPSYIDDLDKFQSNLSINSKSISSDRDYAETQLDDEEVSDTKELSAPKLGIKDMKDLDEIQRVIDSGLVEKLKVEQCKVYLRKHGLRLTGKKDTLVQRIKEHSEIMNGGGEKKFPPSSFVLNCKGDACMGDIVMFEQTVYEGYSIVSRSATGPPCGKRIVAGRIVKESYGAAKQQHTFTVEVLWSKGHKPLPPLHPLLIKGRNLYRLNTLRQRWEDESERQQILSEKHCRGSLARSNREARIQEKVSKKMLKGARICPKERQHLRQEKNHRLATGQISNYDSKNVGSKAQKQHTVAKKIQQQQQTNKDENLKVPVEYKENSYVGLPISQPSRQIKPNIPASDTYVKPTSRLCLGYIDLNSSLSHIAPAKFQQILHPQHLHHSVQTVLKPQPLQQKTSSTSTCHFYQKLSSCFIDNGNFITSASSLLHPQNQLLVSNRTSLHSSYGRNHQKEPQQLCRHYPRGKCYYGTRCKFLHVSNRNYDKF